jgi:hypothetical protein
LQSDTCGDNICVDAKELKAWKHRGYRKRQDVNPRRVNQPVIATPDMENVHASLLRAGGIAMACLSLRQTVKSGLRIGSVAGCSGVSNVFVSQRGR